MTVGQRRCCEFPFFCHMTARLSSSWANDGAWALAPGPVRIGNPHTPLNCLTNVFNLITFVVFLYSKSHCKLVKKKNCKLVTLIPKIGVGLGSNPRLDAWEALVFFKLFILIQYKYNYSCVDSNIRTTDSIVYVNVIDIPQHKSSFRPLIDR